MEVGLTEQSAWNIVYDKTWRDVDSEYRGVPRPTLPRPPRRSQEAEQKRLAIQQAWLSGTQTKSAIARDLGVSNSYVCRIVSSLRL